MLNDTMLGDSLEIIKFKITLTTDDIPLLDPEYENSDEFKERVLYYSEKYVSILGYYNKPYFDDMSYLSRRYVDFLLFKFKENVKLFWDLRNYNYIYKDKLTEFYMNSLSAECKTIKLLLRVFIDNVTEENYINNKKSKYDDLIEWCEKKVHISKSALLKYVFDSVSQYGLTKEIMKEIDIPYHAETRSFGDKMSDLLNIQPVYKLIHIINLDD